MRNSYDLIGLNAEIEALDNRIPGELQLDLFASVQDLLLDRIVWFLRNVDLGHGLAAVIDHYQAGIATVAASFDGALTEAARAARAARVAELVGAGVPDATARRIADLPWLGPAADIVLVADRAGSIRSPTWRRPTSRPAPISSSTASPRRPRRVPIADYFDRLALDRSLDTIGDAERRIAAEMMATGAPGNAAVEAWVAARRDNVERVRMAVHEIAASGLTLSKLSVAASMLGDLAR